MSTSNNIFDDNKMKSFDPNMTNSNNNEILNDLLNFSKDQIVVPDAGYFSNRPRFRTFTVEGVTEKFDILRLGEGTSRWDLYATPDEFLLGRVLPVYRVQDFIDYLHDYMPYSAAVMLFPWIMKIIVTLPIQIITKWKQQKIMPMLPQAMKEYREGATKYKHDRTKTNQFNKFIKNKYGFNPLYASLRPLIGALIQMPIHMSCFIATRTMYTSYPDWKYGGYLWFKDLSAVDPYWVLPIFCSAFMGLGMINAQRLQGSESFTMGLPPEVIKFGMGIFCLIVVPFTHWFPAGFNLYMASNTLSYIAQTTLIQNDQFRSLFGIKPVSYELQYTRELREINQQSTREHRINYMDSMDKKEAIMTRKERQNQIRDDNLKRRNSSKKTLTK